MYSQCTYTHHTCVWMFYTFFMLAYWPKLKESGCHTCWNKQANKPTSSSFQILNERFFWMNWTHMNHMIWRWKKSIFSACQHYRSSCEYMNNKDLVLFLPSETAEKKNKRFRMIDPTIVTTWDKRYRNLWAVNTKKVLPNCTYFVYVINKWIQTQIKLCVRVFFSEHILFQIWIYVSFRQYILQYTWGAQSFPRNASITMLNSKIKNNANKKAKRVQDGNVNITASPRPMCCIQPFFLQFAWRARFCACLWMCESSVFFQLFLFFSPVPTIYEFCFHISLYSFLSHFIPPAYTLS